MAVLEAILWDFVEVRWLYWRTFKYPLFSRVVEVTLWVWVGTDDDWNIVVLIRLKFIGSSLVTGLDEDLHGVVCAAVQLEPRPLH